MKKYVLLLACSLALVCLLGVLPVAAASTGGIAFVSLRSGNEDIYLMNTDGSGQTQLTTNASIDFDPTWSPDGTRIAFSTNRDSTIGFSPEIYTMNADGSDLVRLTNNNDKDQLPSWSPNGTLIAFASPRTGDYDIYVMNADGSSGENPTRLTTDPGQDEFASWSPDSSRIAFYSDRDGNGNIYLMNADGSGQTPLTTTAADDRYPSWSPDGTWIAFVSNRDDPDGDIYIMYADGSSGQNPTRLTTNTAEDSSPSWSPDGTRIAFESDRDGNPNIYVMNADGSGQTPLTTSPAADGEPKWEPDNLPSITGITVPAVPVAVGAIVSPTGTFTDADATDTHMAIWTWGDGNTQVTQLPAGQTTVTGAHAYAAAGIYTVQLVVADNRGGVSVAFSSPSYVVVFNPKGGYVAGTGSIASPAGAYVANQSLTGPATFGFTSKYSTGSSKKGSTVTPQGTTEFRFQLGDLTFKSSSYEWLVISGQKVTFKGTGTINKKGTYQFLLSAIDGQPDTFRIKLVDKNSGSLIYDNKIGAVDTADPTTAIASGSITITKP